MKSYWKSIAVLLALLLSSQPCQAGKLRAYVTGFAVAGAENKEELKQALQTMLMSRLNGETIVALDQQEDAEILISGSYVVFGNVFSIDAIAKTTSGVMINRAFVQGDTQKELIPAIGTLARQLNRSIMEWSQTVLERPVAVTPPPKAAAAAAALPANTAPAATATMPPAVKEATPVEPKSAPLPVQSVVRVTAEQSWISPRYPETLNGIARGRTVAGGEVEIFVTGEHLLRYYRKGTGLQLISEVVFKADEKVLGVDTADLDKDGVPEVYVTILRGESPASQVFVPDGSNLNKIADNLPYLLRGIAPGGKEQKIFAQDINEFTKSYGDVYELTKKGNEFAIRNPAKLPLFGNIYNFNKFTDAKRNSFYTVYHPDGFLMVFSQEKKLLWKSTDKFGGNETCLRQTDGPEASSPLSATCVTPLTQRIQVTGDGNIIVPRNTGLAVIGATRTYARSALLELSWDGKSMQEKWHSGQNQKYLADFCYDNQSRELLFLEVEQKEGLNERGSRIVAKKVE